ncbi:MAG: type II toxin-antitoxin system Phd/YefM family antitoxin [Cyanobacteria bacterium P01_E01_bin.42]
MKNITVAELKGNIDRLLDEILTTSIPVEIERGGKRFRLVSVETKDKLQNLIHRPDAIVGDPDELIEIN